uniref:Putative capsid protein n=1 Tax=Emberiza spodocephala CRESS-DNA-virus sp. TaxID=2815033 RepID=A0A8A4XC39_9VIRU|nr:MAG: putative capsid protein [Emberiza spodocephala CRESS-DNA-virus sp.]
MYGQLTPYNRLVGGKLWGRTAQRIVNTNPSVRLAKMVYKYGPGAARAAYKIGRAWRRSRNRRVVNPYKKKPKPVMYRRTDRSARNPSRKKGTDPGLPSASYPGGTLNLFTFPYPAYDNGTLSSDNLISRTRNTIKLKGIKICQRFTHTQNQGSEAYQGHLRVRWYLCQMKTGTAPGSSSSLNPHFFRTNHDGFNRNRDFQPNTGDLGDDYDFAKICAPVNPDESFRIITKREFSLIGRVDTTDQRSVPFQWTIDEWFPSGKRYTFDTTSSGAPNGEIFVVWWYYPSSSLLYDPSIANNNFVHVHRHDTLYWGESP